MSDCEKCLSEPDSPEAKELAGLLGDHQMFGSDLQMDLFVTIRLGGTPYGMYKQALREVMDKKRALQEFYLERKRVALEAREIDYRKAMNCLGKEKEALDREANKLKAAELEAVIADTERVFNRFLSQARELKKHLGEITDEKRQKLDKEMWETKVKAMVATDLLTRGRLSPETLSLTQVMPLAFRRKLAAELKTQEGKDRFTRDFMTHEPLAQLAGGGKALTGE